VLPSRSRRRVNALQTYTVPVPRDDPVGPRVGADTLETLAVCLGLLGADFTVTGPPELVGHLRGLAQRYARATE
jgi:hypothetical protein